LLEDVFQLAVFAHQVVADVFDGRMPKQILGFECGVQDKPMWTAS
jgi:hypothetical protein